MRYKIPLREASAAFDQRRPFDCNGTLRGDSGRPISYGWLPRVWVNYIQQFSYMITYTVRSYQTPIAWAMRDGRVIVPPVSYSQTTGRHQRMLGLRQSPPIVVDTDEEVAA